MPPPWHVDSVFTNWLTCDSLAAHVHVQVRAQRPHTFQTVRVVAPKDPLEARVLSMLTEDRAQTSMNYVEFLCHVHRQIQQKFA